MTQRLCAGLLKQFLPLVICSGLAAVGWAQSFPPAWKSTSSYAVGDQVQLNGNVLRCTHAVTPGGFKYDEWELWQVRSNTVLTVGVGQTFSTLQTAWQYALNARIAQGAYLHLYISTAKGSFSGSLGNGFSLDQPFGASISIIGDNAAKISLTTNLNGLTIDQGNRFGSIIGLTITGQAGKGSGLYADTDSFVDNVSGTTFSTFYSGASVANGSVVLFDSTCTCSNFTVGLLAQARGSISATEIHLNGSSVAGSTCLEADDEGRISAELCQLTSAGTGASTTNRGYIDMTEATVTGTTLPISATLGSFVEAVSSSISGYSSFAATAMKGAIIDLTGTSGLTTLVGNSDGSYIYAPSF